MRRLLLFNSSNDLALATGTHEYIAPKSVAKMEKELATLPAWWGEEGDAVIVGSSEDAATTSEFFAQHNKKILFTSDEEGYDALCKRAGHNFIPCPWGWSKATAERFLKFGVPVPLIPDNNSLETIRSLSSREFAADYIKELLAEAKGQGLSDMLVGSKMRFIHSLDELEITERTIFKSPWSSSGRGVFSADSLDAPSIREKLTGFIKRQGGFIADKLYNKILDFALEYNISTGGEVTFLGFSVFVAGENGYYGYNIVKSQADLRDMIISKGCNEDMLNWLIETHRRLLHHGLAHKYSGPVGIDLLLANEGNGITIHPCIEINLRMNMGILAICVNNSGEDNRLLVPYRSNGFTAEVKEGRLIIGYNR